MGNINFLNEQNKIVYKKFLDFEHENLHKLDYCYSSMLNKLLSSDSYSKQLDFYFTQNMIFCEFELEKDKEKDPKDLIMSTYSHEEFLLLIIRTTYRAANKDCKIYDSMLDDELNEFELDENA